MRKQFDYELKELSFEIVKMATDANIAIQKSIESLTTKNTDLAKSVIAGDDKIDELEKQIEKRALQIIIRYQPVAKDLRSVTTALKMTTDIERIADQASDIAAITIHLAEEKYIKDIVHLPKMGEWVIKMLTESVTSFVNKDLKLASQVIKDDDTADKMYVEIKEELIQYLKKIPNSAEQILYFMIVAKYLERIGDHAVNIAQWVIFEESGLHKNSKIL